MPSGLSDAPPTVWAEFVILRGRQDAPTIHARKSLDVALEVLCALLQEGKTPEEAKAAFQAELTRWVRHV